MTVTWKMAITSNVKQMAKQDGRPSRLPCSLVKYSCTDNWIGHTVANYPRLLFQRRRKNDLTSQSCSAARFWGSLPKYGEKLSPWLGCMWGGQRSFLRGGGGVRVWGEAWKTRTGPLSPLMAHALCWSCLRLLLKKGEYLYYLFHELHDDLISFKDPWYY